jgi:hypothetical protein
MAVSRMHGFTRRLSLQRDLANWTDVCRGDEKGALTQVRRNNNERQYDNPWPKLSIPPSQTINSSEPPFELSSPPWARTYSNIYESLTTQKGFKISAGSDVYEYSGCPNNSEATRRDVWKTRI